MPLGLIASLSRWTNILLSLFYLTEPSPTASEVVEVDARKAVETLTAGLYNDNVNIESAGLMTCFAAGHLSGGGWAN